MWLQKTDHSIGLSGCFGLTEKTGSKDIEDIIYIFGEKQIVLQYPHEMISMTNRDTFTVTTLKNSREYVDCKV